MKVEYWIKNEGYESEYLMFKSKLKNGEKNGKCEKGYFPKWQFPFWQFFLKI